MLGRFHSMKMRAACYSLLHLLIFIIADNYLIITDCADSGGRRNENTTTGPSTSRAEKAKNVKRLKFTPESETGAGSSNREQMAWSKNTENELLSAYFSHWLNNNANWRQSFASLRVTHPNIPSSDVTYSHVYKLVRKILESTPALGEGDVLWTKKMKFAVLKIYYQTKGGNEMKHADRMYQKWRGEFRHFPIIHPMHLLHQAENMLIRTGLLVPSNDISDERITKINADRVFKSTVEQDDLIRKAYEEIPPEEPCPIHEFYDNLCQKCPELYGVSPRKIFGKGQYLMKRRQKRQQIVQVKAGEDIDSRNQSRQKVHHHYHEIIDVQDDPLMHPYSVDQYTKEMGSSSLHQSSSFHHLDLNLSLGSATVDTPQIHHPNLDLELGTSRIHHPNLDLELGTPQIYHSDMDPVVDSLSKKEKGKSIWKGGS